MTSQCCASLARSALLLAGLASCAAGGSGPGAPAPPTPAPPPPAATPAPPLVRVDSPAPVISTSGTARALLIGINEYVEVPDLRGAINDIEMVGELLRTRYGFLPADIEILTDEAATRSGILAALDRLVERTRPGDTVYLHYSGHGSQAMDTNSDEEDGLDETLIPHDGRTPGIADITDDELARSLARLPDARVVIVLDSCHSGTATRGFVQARAVPRDTRDSLYAGPTTRAVVPLVQANHVLFTGASAQQQALDGPVDGRAHGLFTYALVRSLSNAPAGATPRDVLGGAEQELERVKAQLGLPSMPEPQLEAERERLGQPFFGGGDAPPARLPWVEVRPEGGMLRLQRARSLGAEPGSLWAVYPPGEVEFAPGGALAEARVTELRGDDALARALPAGASVESGSRAAFLAPPDAGDALPVRLEDPDPERAARLRRALLAELPELEFVDADAFARFVLRRQASGVRVEAADGSTEVANFETDREAELVGALVLLLRRWSTAADLLALENPMTTIELRIGVEGVPDQREQRSPERGVSVVADTGAHVFRIRQPGQARTPSNSLQLRVESSAACYLSVVDVDSEGGLNVLFPNAISEGRGYHPGGRIEAREAVLIPDSLESGNRAGFHLDYGPPAGTDTVRAFCAADAAVAQALRSAIESLAGAPSTRSASAASVRAALRGRVREALSAATSRGVRIVADTPDPDPDPEVDASAAPAEPPEESAEPIAAPDWAAASVTLDVVE